jgi:hypothetical protein
MYLFLNYYYFSSYLILSYFKSFAKSIFLSWKFFKACSRGTSSFIFYPWILNFWFDFFGLTYFLIGFIGILWIILCSILLEIFGKISLGLTYLGELFINFLISVFVMRRSTENDSLKLYFCIVLFWYLLIFSIELPRESP